MNRLLLASFAAGALLLVASNCGSTSSCDAKNCPLGCCSAGVCLPGTTTGACGTNGAECTTCTSTQQCVTNQCLSASTGGGSGTGGGTATGGGGGSSAASKRLFLTSSIHSGNLRAEGDAGTGLAGADALCLRQATAAGLGGTWVAYLSDDTTDAYTRLGTGPWVNVADGGVVFRDLAQVRMGSPSSDPSIDERGRNDTAAGFSRRDFWHGSATDGTRVTGKNCRNWTTSSATANEAGLAGRYLAGSLDNDPLPQAPCLEPYYLLCFER